MIDPQMKRGILDVCVLSVLSRDDSYGYKIVKDLEQQQIKISESTLYPILRRLEASEALTVYSMEHNGRLRKIYKITEKGQHQIDDFLDSWQEIIKVYNFIREGTKHE